MITMTMLPKCALAALVAGVLTSRVIAAPLNVISSLQDLPFDENGRLVSHQVLYPAGDPYCIVSKLAETEGFELHPVTGEALQEVFPGADEEQCKAVCLEKGTDRSVVHAAMPHRHWNGEGKFHEWFQETCRRVEVCLMNYHSRETPVKVYWIHPDTGELKLHMEIKFGEHGTRCFHSFVGHEFLAEDGATGEELETFKVGHITTKAFGISPPNANPARRNFEKEVVKTLNNEWNRHNRVPRTFSELGFKKGRLPDDVFASMGSFYYNNRFNKVREEWEGKGVFVNWWETDCSFVQLPWELKGKWQIRLKDLVEAWAGVPIEQTDMYGLRQYEHGARLLTHVDREATHAVSLIVNIAQGNLTEPWPVEVNDHANRLHEVIMEPGDIVYYESARCLHGRNRALMGDDAYYVNLFTHYRPVGDPEWFQKPNHEGVPDPVLEVEGECRLEKVSTAQTPNKQLGVVQAVRCDDERLGPHVSPSLFRVTSAEDLIEWWHRTSPPGHTGSISGKNSSSGRDEL